ncbi:MAG: hypothetical protein R3F41_01355 [Gammaproteobacteria bacterium]|nr:hypothetical protein [Pseudomonadales bacterium]
MSDQQKSTGASASTKKDDAPAPARLADIKVSRAERKTSPANPFAALQSGQSGSRGKDPSSGNKKQ